MRIFVYHHLKYVGYDDFTAVLKGKEDDILEEEEDGFKEPERKKEEVNPYFKRPYTIEIPSRVKVDHVYYTIRGIGAHLFEGEEYLEGISLPYGVREIGQGAFRSCSSLESILFPDTLLSVSPGAFDSCSSLSYVHIGKRLKHIREDAFVGCSNLKKADIDPGNPYLLGFENGFLIRKENIKEA